MKGILEQLSVRAFTLAHLLYFNEDFGSAWLMAQGEVNASAADGVLWTNNLSIEDRPV